jgi:hypothetical protein
MNLDLHVACIPAERVQSPCHHQGLDFASFNALCWSDRGSDAEHIRTICASGGDENAQNGAPRIKKQSTAWNNSKQHETKHSFGFTFLP